MKKLVICITTLIISTISFAGSSNPIKNSSLGNLASSWNATQTNQLTPGHDINIVYGGKDVSQKHALIAATAIA